MCNYAHPSKRRSSDIGVKASLFSVNIMKVWMDDVSLLLELIKTLEGRRHRQSPHLAPTFAVLRQLPRGSCYVFLRYDRHNDTHDSRVEGYITLTKLTSGRLQDEKTNMYVSGLLKNMYQLALPPGNTHFPSCLNFRDTITIAMKSIVAQTHV